ncbi:MAG: COR domain-containing protein [Anaerolineales bacterium]|nr:MAG: COR domain-containing protein [Anaerolineales bacterium]
MMAEKTGYEIATERIRDTMRRGIIELDLSLLNFEVLPPEIGQLSQLTSLRLINNSLSQLPRQLEQLSRLKELNLYHNKLTSLPPEIGKLTELTTLDLRNNQLTSLPPEIGQLTQLTTLDLRNNQLTSLPPEIGQLTQLTTLDLRNNQLASLPPEIGQLTQLTTLDLRNNQLTSLPPEVGQLTNLTSIQLSSNLITSLPSEISQITQLPSLDISNNKLNNLPPEIGNLASLIILDASNNELLDLPPEIGRLIKLDKLDLSNNKLSSLPQEIGDLIRLTSLKISRNKLTVIPSKIKQISILTLLDLAENQLTFLPPEIGQLHRLSWLSLRSNKLSSLPQSLQNLRTLRHLDLLDNPLNIPPEILKIEESQAILKYLAEIEAHKQRPLAETKMLVVGQGNVGKTSLIRRLTNDTFSSSETKTKGITINRWQVENVQTGEKQPETLRVNIWDFGGQEIMHATHQFFLTRRSLYLLVLDARLTQEENRIEYWLKIIQSFGGDSPVLLVGNKTDQHPLDIDRTGLQKKYPNIVGILSTSALSGAGLDDLEEAISNQVNALPHVHDVLPETWFNVKRQLEDFGLNQNYISHERYSEICAAGEIRDETSQRTLIGFLHDLGIVLHFQDDPRLETLGILNPQWVTNGVYKILNDHALFQNKGVLKRTMLADILPEEDYPANKRLFIVDMMRKFELCYDIVPEQTFLVPDLLPKDEPFTGEWEGALAFQYHYNVLPSSIISRFIVRMNGFIHKTIWRSGVVLNKDGNTALVKADTEDRKIYIWVNGAENTRRDFLSVIRAEFDAIHKTIIKIEAVQKVPHPEYHELVLDYKELIDFERDGIAEFPRSVDGKTVMVNVRQLLNGVRVGDEPAPQPRPKQNIETPKVEPLPEKPVESADGKQPLVVKIMSALFVSLPRVIGRFVLDIFGRGKDSADSSSIVLGYVLIILAVLVVWGIVDPNSLRDWFVGWWRFFFPMKP